MIHLYIFVLYFLGLSQTTPINPTSLDFQFFTFTNSQTSLHFEPGSSRRLCQGCQSTKRLCSKASIPAKELMELCGICLKKMFVVHTLGQVLGHGQLSSHQWSLLYLFLSDPPEIKHVMTWWSCFSHQLTYKEIIIDLEHGGIDTGTKAFNF